MALDKRQIDAIEMLVEGEHNKTEIAELVGIRRQTLYDWFAKEEFIKEWDKRIHEAKTLTHKGFDAKLEKAKDKLWGIINSDVDVRTREKALEYWINRCVGTPTSKTETTITETTNNIGNTKDLIDKYKQLKQQQSETDHTEE